MPGTPSDSPQAISTVHPRAGCDDGAGPPRKLTRLPSNSCGDAIVQRAFGGDEHDVDNFWMHQLLRAAEAKDQGLNAARRRAGHGPRRRMPCDLLVFEPGERRPRRWRDEVLR